jgi:hypothetical protein
MRHNTGVTRSLAGDALLDPAKRTSQNGPDLTEKHPNILKSLAAAANK